MVSAAWTVLVSISRSHDMLGIRPDVEGLKCSVDGFDVACQQFDRLSHLMGRDAMDDRTKYACGFAGRCRAGGRWFGKEAAQARAFARNHHGAHPRGTDGAAVDPWCAARHTEVIQEISGLEVVQSIDDQITTVRQAADVGGIDVVDDRLHVDSGVDGPEAVTCRGRLRCADVRFVVEHLTLEIREFDDITIHKTDPTDASPREQVRGDGSQCTATDQKHARLIQPLLTFFTDSGNQHLSVVAFHGHEDSVLRCAWR